MVGTALTGASGSDDAALGAEDANAEALAAGTVGWCSVRAKSMVAKPPASVATIPVTMSVVFERGPDGERALGMRSAAIHDVLVPRGVDDSAPVDLCGLGCVLG